MSEVGSGSVYWVWCALAIATAMAALIFWVRPIMVWNLNHPAFLAAVIRLFKANNAERALKLCHAVPKALVPTILKPTIALALKRAASDPGALTAELVHTLKSEGDAALDQLRRWNAFGLPAIGALMATGAVIGARFPHAWWQGQVDLRTQWPWLLLSGAALATGWGAIASKAIGKALRAAPIDYIPTLVESVTGHHVANYEVERLLNPHSAEERASLENYGQSSKQMREGFRLHPPRDPRQNLAEPASDHTRTWPLRLETRKGWLSSLGKPDGKATLEGHTLTLSMDQGAPQSVDLEKVQVAHLHVWPEAGRRRWLELSLSHAATRVAFQSPLPDARIPDKAARLQSSAPIAPTHMLLTIWDLLRELESQRGHTPPPTI